MLQYTWPTTTPSSHHSFLYHLVTHITSSWGRALPNSPPLVFVPSHFPWASQHMSAFAIPSWFQVSIILSTLLNNISCLVDVSSMGKIPLLISPFPPSQPKPSQTLKSAWSTPLFISHQNSPRWYLTPLLIPNPPSTQHLLSHVNLLLSPVQLRSPLPPPPYQPRSP